MSRATLWSISAPSVPWALAGFALGLLYFATLHRTAILLAAGRGWVRPLVLSLARFAAAIGLLTLAARMGASALLAALLGFLCARTVAVRCVRRAG